MYLVIGRGPAYTREVREADPAIAEAWQAYELGLLHWDPEQHDYAVLLGEDPDEPTAVLVIPWPPAS